MVLPSHRNCNDQLSKAQVTHLYIGKKLAFLVVDFSSQQSMERENDNYINKGNNNDDGEWRTVTNRKKKSTKQQTISYFFTDIPMGWNDVALWKTFAKYGRISDVYIAKKKTLNGKTFGFARFTDIQNPKAFESTLNSITVGTQRISVNIARYQNGRNNSARQQPHNSTHHHQPQNTSEPRHLANIPTSKSYAHILNTKTPSKTSQPPKPMTIHSCPDLTTSFEHSLVGELFTIETLPTQPPHHLHGKRPT